MTSAGKEKLVQYSLAQIERGMQNEDYARTLAHFCVVFKLRPALKATMKEQFLLAAAMHTARLESEHRWKELFDCYQELLGADDGCGELYHWLGALLFRGGYAPEAVSAIARALELSPGLSEARGSLDGIRVALLERWHFPMLNDSARNAAFSTAISAAVRSGHRRILDVGTGTGLLGLFALGAGAEKVYACETCPISCATARAVFRANNFDAKVINKHSTQLTVPGDLDDRVSLLVTETFDAALLGEGALPNLLHAWENLLQRDPAGPAPRIIPDEAEVFVCLLESKAIRRQTRVRRAVREALGGIGEVEHRSRGPYTTARLDRLPGGYRTLSPPLRVFSANFNDYEALKELAEKGPWRAELQCSRAGRLDAVCLWFRLRVGDVWLDTLRGDTCWEQAIYRASSAAVAEGERVGLKVTCGDRIDLAVESRRVVVEPPVQLRGCEIRLADGCAVPLSRAALHVPLPPLARVLDLSSVPLLGLFLLKGDDGRHLTTLEGRSSELVSRFLQTHRLKNHAWTESVEDAGLPRGPGFDVLVIDVWDASGNLRSLLLETVALLRTTCLKPRATILPGSWSMHGVLIESTALEVQSRLLSDRHTLGWKVADCLNGWARVSHHQDICLSTLPRRALCDPLELLHVDLARDAELPSARHRVEILREGRISACVYWFRASYPGGNVVSNFSERGSLRQAAVVFAKPMNVCYGQRLTMTVSCTDGRPDVCLEVDDGARTSQPRPGESR